MNHDTEIFLIYIVMYLSGILCGLAIAKIIKEK
jgi:hypothetical protein